MVNCQTTCLGEQITISLRGSSSMSHLGRPECTCLNCHEMLQAGSDVVSHLSVQKAASMQANDPHQLHIVVFQAKPAQHNGI